MLRRRGHVVIVGNGGRARRGLRSATCGNDIRIHRATAHEAILADAQDQIPPHAPAIRPRVVAASNAGQGRPDATLRVLLAGLARARARG